MLLIIQRSIIIVYGIEHCFIYVFYPQLFLQQPNSKFEMKVVTDNKFMI